MKHTRQDLNIMQGWSLEEKIKVSQMKILEWYRAYSGQVFTSFSGGKDSTVLLDLARQVCPDIPAVYVDTASKYGSSGFLSFNSSMIRPIWSPQSPR